MDLLDKGNLAITDAQVHLWKDVAIPGREHRKVPLLSKELLSEMAVAGVARAIVIPPSWGGDGNRLVKEAARSHPRSLAAIGRFGVDDPSLLSSLETWDVQNGLLGLRLLFNTPAYVGMLREGVCDWIWPRAEEKNVPLMMLVQESDDCLGSIAARHPRLRLIIDHLGVGGGGSHFRDRIDALLTLSIHPNIAVKATALPLYSQVEYPHADVLDQVRRVVDAYSPDRVFWGTDLSRLRCTYRHAVEMMASFEWRDRYEMEHVMGDSILQWLSWGAHI